MVSPLHIVLFPHVIWLKHQLDFDTPVDQHFVDQTGFSFCPLRSATSTRTNIEMSHNSTCRGTFTQHGCISTVRKTWISAISMLRLDHFQRQKDHGNRTDEFSFTNMWIELRISEVTWFEMGEITSNWTDPRHVFSARIRSLSSVGWHSVYNPPYDNLAEIGFHRSFRSPNSNSHWNCERRNSFLESTSHISTVSFVGM